MRARAAAACVLAALLTACAQTPSPPPAGIIADDAPEIGARPAYYDLADVSGPDAPGMPGMWVLEKNGRTLAVFGTMHVVPQGFRWLRPDVKRAFAEADLVVTEVGTTDAAQYNPREGELEDLAGLLTRHDGANTLDLVAAPGTPARAELEAAIDMAGVRAASSDSLQAWALCLDLQRSETVEAVRRMTPEARALRTEATQSVGPIETGAGSPDARIERFRISQGLPHRQLETFATRARVYATMPEAEAIACIRHRAHAIVTGADWTEFPRRFHGSFARWTGGDLDGARRAETTEAAQISPGFAERLYQGREAQWLALIAVHCEEARQNCAMAVGFAHLGGPDGLLKRLEQAGYRLKRGTS